LPSIDDQRIDWSGIIMKEFEPYIKKVLFES